MKVKCFLFVAAIFSLFCCDNILDNSILSNMSGINNLSISVLASPTTKDLITSTYFPSTSQIGVFVTNASGGDYDGHTYNNILFTANGSDANQTWNGSSSIELSMNEGKCYAYYPYNSSASDLTKIPVTTTGQVDYMYATPVTVNANNKTASLKMYHALSAVRFMIKKGTYAGTGQVTAVSVKSSALGTSGSLNAKTGEVTEVSGIGSVISVSKSLKLSAVTQDVDVIVVPTGSAADLTLSVTLDGKTYSTVVSEAAITKANCNKYTLTVNQGELALSGIEIGDWGYDDSGAPTITARSYKVTFAGNYSDISFSNSVSGSSIIIEAYAKKDYFQPNEVLKFGSATIGQTAENRLRTITLSDISSDVIITFDGTADYRWKDLTDGVYAITSTYGAVAVAEATSDCIGIALIDSDTGQKLMIEKYEATNSSYATAASGKGSTSNFYWGGYGTNQSIANITTETDAKNDYNGKANSEVFKTVTTGGDGYTSYASIGAVLNQFINNSSENHGFTDWYIPACGQLYLIYQKVSSINSALSAIGGTQLAADYYWSSSEFSAYNGWRVALYGDYVNCQFKYDHCRLRLVRDLS